MSTTLIRSLIAGSVSAVASLTMLAAGGTAHASGGGGGGGPIITIPPITLPAPVACVPLDLANLEVRAAQTGPTNWQWRFLIDGGTDGLCNDTLVATMHDGDTSTDQVVNVTIADIVAATNEGHDLIADFTVPCSYSTSVVMGDMVIDNYSGSGVCPESGAPVPAAPETPVATDPTPTEAPTTTEAPTPSVAPTTTVPVSDVPVRVVTVTIPTTTTIRLRTNTGNMPRTSSDSTTLIGGAAMLVLGLGLAFTSVAMTRRRHHT
jgi:hypothetical protein